MSILIKDMEMPTSCFYCPMRLKVDPDTIKCLATGERFEETFAGTIEMRNRGNCPLVVVPHHGRLIDADALLQHQWVSRDWNCGGVHEIVVSITDIDDAPTIIEAEETNK